MADLALPALLALAFSAGTATFFAPCAFPLLPGYLSYFLGDTVSATETATGTPTRPLVDRVGGPLARAGLVGLAVSLGITVVYVGLAGTTAALGARALADIAILEVVVGCLFVVAGTAMAVGWKVPRSVVQLPERRRSVVGFFVFGVLYAGAAAGCTAPLFLAVVARGLTAGPLFGVGVAAAYAAGTSAVLVVVTGVSAVGSSSVVSALAGYTERIYRVAGGLLALSGVAELYYYAYGIPEVVS
jgi:cytochrome c-type biogenesis protein